MKRATVRLAACACVALSCAAASGARAQVVKDPGSVATAPALKDPQHVRKSGVVAGSAWLAAADARGTLGPETKVGEWRFDDQGRVLDQSSYDRDGVLVQQVTYAYGDRGAVIESVTRGAGPLGDSKTEYRYDAASKLVESKTKRFDGTLVMRAEYVNDAEGRMIEVRTFAADTAGNTRSSIAYDPDGSMRETVVYDASGKVRSRIVMKRDAAGNRQQLSLGAGNDILTSTESSYDAAGRIVREIVRNAAGVAVHESVYRYDGNGNVVETGILSAPAGTMAKLTFAYDANDDFTESRMYDKNDRLVSRVRYEYTYREAAPGSEPKKE